MDKSDRLSVELEAEQRRIDAADVLGAKIDELAKDILSDVESGQGDYFHRWCDDVWEHISDDPTLFHQQLYLLNVPELLTDISLTPGEVAIERLARMRAVFADHQEAWAQREAKQQLEEE